jgi:hypothetical protein
VGGAEWAVEKGVVVGRAHSAGVAGYEEVPVDAGVDAVGETSVGALVADLQADARTQAGEVVAAEPVRVPGDSDRSAGS